MLWWKVVCKENGNRYSRGSSAAREDVATHIVSEWDHPRCLDLNLAPLAGHSHPERRRSMEILLFGWRALALTALALRLRRAQQASLELCVISPSEDQLVRQYIDWDKSAKTSAVSRLPPLDCVLSDWDGSLTPQALNYLHWWMHGISNTSKLCSYEVVKIWTNRSKLLPACNHTNPAISLFLLRVTKLWIYRLLIAIS